MNAPMEPRAEETGEKGAIAELLLENKKTCDENMKRNPAYNGTGGPFSAPMLSI